MQATASIEELTASSLNITSQQEELNSEINKVVEVTEQGRGQATAYLYGYQTARA